MRFFKNVFQIKPKKSGVVFIVEDDRIYAQMLEFHIRQHFPSIHTVRTFNVGETALVCLDQNPDLIIMDYHLNSRYEDADNGLETIKKVRSQNKKTNIIALSSQANVEVVVEAVRTYNCSYIRKDERSFSRIGSIIKKVYYC